MDASDPETPWYSLDAGAVLDRLGVAPEGLTEDEVVARRERSGPNSIETEESDPAWRILVGQFLNVLTGILVASAVISFWLGDAVEGVTILVIVALAGLFGFVQEFKAEQAMKELQRLTAPRTRVRRSGVDRTIPSFDLVPGDVVPLVAGDVVPADGRLLESHELRTDEAVLTGESAPVEKAVDAVAGDSLPIGDRTSMVHGGTAVVHGRATAVVVETGMRSEFGKIAGLLAEQRADRTPLQQDLDRLGRYLGIGSLALAAAVAAFGVVRGHEVAEMFIWGVALAIAVIPEALPAVVTIGLALAVKRMVHHRALVRRLPAVETLGATEVICSDKTGTLTTGRMSVRHLEPASPAARDELLRAIALCNDATIDGDAIHGDPSESALLAHLRDEGVDVAAIRAGARRTGEVPFSSDRKRMTTLHDGPDGRLALTKGAAEVVLAACDRIRTDDGEVALDADGRAALDATLGRMAGEALRAMAVAGKRLTGDEGPAESDRGLVFLGLVGLMDPPRPEARAAVETCRRAGIRTVMITGDHLATARAIADEIGILDGGESVRGPELEAMSDEELDRRVDSISVYARVDPSHKLRIVESFKRLGRVVAMTGDGVNDAPALKRADIGIAMGRSGTGVSREASDMVLTDDDFASIVEAVEEGRRTYDNIRKYLIFILSGNMGAIFAMIYALFADFPLPLVAVQILFINMILDGLPAIALSVEAAEPGLMRRPPRNRAQPILDRMAVFQILAIGLLIAAASLWAFLAEDPMTHPARAMTMFFATLVVCRLVKGFYCRSFVASAFAMNPLGNRWLLAGVASALGLTVLVIEVPFLADVFRLEPLTLADWGRVAALGGALFLALEGIKLLRRMAGPKSGTPLAKKLTPPPERLP